MGPAHQNAALLDDRSLETACETPGGEFLRPSLVEQEESLLLMLKLYLPPSWEMTLDKCAPSPYDNAPVPERPSPEVS
jgi:hypothetical protein